MGFIKVNKGNLLCFAVDKHAGPTYTKGNMLLFFSGTKKITRGNNANTKRKDNPLRYRLDCH